MKKLLLQVMVILLSASPIYAIGTDITIYDENSSEINGWHGQNENNEVEPGMAIGQQWDLEGFFLDGNMLSVVGGFDFDDGVMGAYLFESGDIFLDIDDDAVFGNINGNFRDMVRAVDNIYGYDYVLDIDWSMGTYDVLSLGADARLNTVYYNQNQGASPWQYVSGGGVVSTGNPLDYFEGVDRYDSLLGNENRNEVVVDIGFLSDEGYADFTSHFTMECGNDNLMGRGAIPNPEPATMILIGFGLIGFAGVARRKLT